MMHWMTLRWQQQTRTITPVFNNFKMFYIRGKTSTHYLRISCVQAFFTPFEVNFKLQATHGWIKHKISFPTVYDKSTFESIKGCTRNQPTLGISWLLAGSTRCSIRKDPLWRQIKLKIIDVRYTGLNLNSRLRSSDRFVQKYPVLLGSAYTL